jgi:hypothetical protein
MRNIFRIPIKQCKQLVLFVNNLHYFVSNIYYSVNMRIWLVLIDIYLPRDICSACTSEKIKILLQISISLLWIPIKQCKQLVLFVNNLHYFVSNIYSNVMSSNHVHGEVCSTQLLYFWKNQNIITNLNQFTLYSFILLSHGHIYNKQGQ